MITTCHGPECDRRAVAKGLCQTHYKQMRSRGVLSVIGTTTGTRREPRTPDRLPPGWHKASSKARDTAVNPHAREDVLVYHSGTLAEDLALLAANAPRMRAVLAAHDALDLADMLGVGR